MTDIVCAGRTWAIPAKILVALLLVAAALSACGGGGGGGHASASTDTPASPAAGANAPSTDPALEAPTQAESPSLPISRQPRAPSPPPALLLPAGAPMSNVCVAARPVGATSSATANAGNSAAKAIDGDLSTRWESAYVDDAWIQFDFGAKTQVGYMKLTWENAYGKEYAIQASDDGQAWYQFRYVVGGQGGTEEFFNLGANVRYIRLQGAARGTQYGYSLFDVQFQAPCSDNSIAQVATSEIAFPASGSGLAPAPAQAPLETLQFSLPDGTLVTRFGVIGRSRHARERGEDWNEIGFGPNDTVDAAGNPVDRGPGNYLNFVANYFKNRTWGFEIIDNSRVAGVTRPTLRVNQYFREAQKAGGHSFFRAFDRPGVTGYGWMASGQLVNPALYGTNLADCPVVPFPPDDRLADPVKVLNDGCSVTVDAYPGHAALAADGNGVLVPNGLSVPARPLVVGDVVEVSTSFFSTPEAMAAVNDTGRLRYYTNEWTYVVGVGLRPWYGVQPRLMNAPLPDETLQGGLGSVSYDYADNATFMFQQPHNDIGMQNMQRFAEGRRWLHTNMWTGDHNEPDNDRNVQAMRLQGARFTQSSCFACHINNGRGVAPLVVNQLLDTMGVRTAAADANGRQVPDPIYGMSAQMHARSLSTGALQDWGTGVRVAGFDTRIVNLADGTPVELSKPKFSFDGPTPATYSVRSAQPLVGMGLLEAVPDADILALARTTPDADGVKGQPNYVYDPETGDVRLGRYGWKASKASLRHQAAAALLLDMSVTSPIFPSRDCLSGPVTCRSGRVEAGIPEDVLKLITRYLGLLGVPAQRSQASGFPKGVSPLPYLDVNPTQVANGARVFDGIRCTACHVAQMRTGSGSELSEVRNQIIRPYTDLLLHDMGADLADNFVEGQATGSMWRTSALWGIGYTARVAGKNIPVGYLHDGRARTLTEAILWHGGEGTASRSRFEGLAKADRDALLAFLNSL